MSKCKYCGRPLSLERRKRGLICPACSMKTTLLPRFAVARDKIRKATGLKPLKRIAQKGVGDDE